MQIKLDETYDAWETLLNRKLKKEEKEVVKRCWKSMQDDNPYWRGNNIRHPIDGKLVPAQRIRYSGAALTIVSKPGWYAEIKMYKVDENEPKKKSKKSKKKS